MNCGENKVRENWKESKKDIEFCDAYRLHL